MNIYDIAKTAGVSTATVSRYLNKSGYVSKKTAETIERVISSAHYSPSAAAKSLSTGKSFKLIGIVCYNIDDLYYAKAVSVLEKLLKQSGYEIVLSCTGESVEEKMRSVKMLIKKNVDAIIFIGSVFMDESGKIIKDAAVYVPCFIINSEISGSNIYCVFCDDKNAVNQTHSLLIKSGCKNTAFLYDVVTYGSLQKLAGFAESGGKTALIVPETFEEIKKQFAVIYNEHKFDAVICSNDLIAAAVIVFAAQNNISVPNQLKVVGHNNSVLAKCTSPALTSIDNKVEKLAALTASNICKLFNNQEVVRSQKVDYKIIRRGSF